MNYLMTKICYQMLVVIQDQAKKVPTSEFGERMKQRSDFYGKIEAKFIKVVSDSEKRKREEGGEAEQTDEAQASSSTE